MATPHWFRDSRVPGAVRRAYQRVIHAGRTRRPLAVLMLLVVALAGAGIGLALGARTVTDIGPFHAEFRVSPGTSGMTSVHIPPVGSLHFDSHDGPAHLTVELGSLDQRETQAIIDNPARLSHVGRTVADDVREGIVRVGFASLGSAVLGAMLLSALVFRDMRRVATSGVLALVVLAAGLGASAATARYSAVDEPRYEGLLVNAPALVGDVQQVTDEWERYAQQLQQMVVNASLLYTTISTLPVFEPDQTMTRVMHVSDLHLNPNAWPVIETVVDQYEVDLIIDSGDIVDWGTGQESAYLDSIADLEVPYVFVRGNHDSVGSTQEAVSQQPNAVVLDNDVATVEGLTIAGIGDPRFSPDQRTDPFMEEPEVDAERVAQAGERLAATVTRQRGPVHLAAVHDPRTATPLEGLVDYVLAGHAHERRVGPVGPPAEQEQSQDDPQQEAPTPPDTLLMVQGSTGGAGLRGLEGEHPEPLAMSVLYFDGEKRLLAYDDITVGGTGQSEVALQRHVVERADEAESEPGGSPSPSPT